jgi:hypothetical protein
MVSLSLGDIGRVIECCPEPRPLRSNPILVEDLDEGLVMLVGADTAGNLLEIGVFDSTDGPIIIHAMTARPKYLR